MRPEILKAHAHLCDRAAPQLKFGNLVILKAVQSSGVIGSPFICSLFVEQSLFLSMSICHYLNARWMELSHWMTRCSDGLRCLVLIGYSQDLSGAVNFDTIRSKSLPLARHDVRATHCANLIRVSLKTAVQFIAELQQREERAFSSPKRDPRLSPKKKGVFAAINSADKHVGDVLDNPLNSESAIKYALEIMKRERRGEDLHEADSGHWNGSRI